MLERPYLPASAKRVVSAAWDRLEQEGKLGGGGDDDDAAPYGGGGLFLVMYDDYGDDM
jgi:hypothetical protein